MRNNSLPLLTTCLMGILLSGCTPDEGPVLEGQTSEVREASSESTPQEVPPTLPPPGELGSVEGHVALRGQAPGNQVIRMGVDPKCNQVNADREFVVQEEFVITRAGDLGNVFLYLEGNLPSLPALEPVKIDQRRCLYHPRVVGAQVGQTVEIWNSDDLLHNLHASSRVGNSFNVGQPRAGMVYRFEPEEPEIMLHLSCDLHRWMTSYIGIVEHSYFDTTSADGLFKIDRVPAGTYTIHTWHEVLGELTESLEIRAGETTTLDLEYAG